MAAPFKIRVHNKHLCGKHTIENLFIPENPLFNITIAAMNELIIKQNGTAKAEHLKLNKPWIENSQGTENVGMLSPHTVNKLIWSTTDCQAEQIK